MKRQDRELGMDRDITRRDFLSGVSVAIGASILPAACVWRIPTLSHKFLQNPSLVMLVLIVTIMAQCVI